MFSQQSLQKRGCLA